MVKNIAVYRRREGKKAGYRSKGQKAEYRREGQDARYRRERQNEGYQGEIQKENQKEGYHREAPGKQKIILAVCTLLLVAGVTKLISNHFLYQKTELVDAFVAKDGKGVVSTLQINADYDAGFLTDHDRQGLITYLANALGVQMDGAIESAEGENSMVISYSKKAKQAETSIKTITLNDNPMKTYLSVELTLYQDMDNDALKYRDMIAKALKELGVNQIETTLLLTGRYEGKLRFDEWNRLADSMIKRLDGEVLYENRDEELYTIYAYSDELPEYVIVAGKKINVQVAVRYEADTDSTVVYLATPLIRGEW